MNENEIAQVIAGVDIAVQQRLATELEQVYAAIDRVRDELPEMYRPVEALREEFRATIEVMDGTDQAIIAKVLEIVDGLSAEGDTPVRLVGEMSGAWTRFITSESERLGLTGNKVGKGRTKGTVDKGDNGE